MDEWMSVLWQGPAVVIAVRGVITIVRDLLDLRRRRMQQDNVKRLTELSGPGGRVTAWNAGVGGVTVVTGRVAEAHGSRSR
jgi:hypothetical protein